MILNTEDISEAIGADFFFYSRHSERHGPKKLLRKYGAHRISFGHGSYNWHKSLEPYAFRNYIGSAEMDTIQMVHPSLSVLKSRLSLQGSLIKEIQHGLRK